MAGIAGSTMQRRSSVESGVAVQVPQIKQRGRRRSLWITAGVGAVSALLMVVALQAYSKRVPVVVANGEIERGQVVDVGDVKVVELSGVSGLNTYNNPNDLVGKIATVSLVDGDVLSSSTVSETIGLGDDQSVTGLVVGPGQYPTKDLKPGDLVDVIAAGSTDDGGGTRLASGVRIHAVLQPEDVGSRTDLLVSVVLDDDQATAVAAQVEQPGGIRLTLRGGK